MKGYNFYMINRLNLNSYIESNFENIIYEINNEDYNTNYTTEASSLEGSYIFNTFNVGHKLTDEILKYIKNAVVVDENMIEEQLLSIKKSRISGLVDKVLNAYRNGDIEILYTEKAKVPVSFPFVVRKKQFPDGIRIVATIFISNYTRLVKDRNILDIALKPLYVLMESAFVAFKYHTNSLIFERNLGLMKVTCKVYTDMLTNILAREYSLTLDQNLYDKVIFSIGRFYLERLWGSKNKDLIFHTASDNILQPNYDDLQLVWDEYDRADITTIVGLMDYIKSLNPRFDTLSMKYIAQRYMTSYHGCAVLTLDYIVYIYFVIINTLHGSFLLNDTMLSNIIKNNKYIKNFYPELAKCVN